MDVKIGEMFSVAVHGWSRHGAVFTISVLESTRARALCDAQRGALDALFVKCCGNTGSCNRNWKGYRTNGTDPCHAAGVRCSTANETVDLDLSQEVLNCTLGADDFSAFNASLKRLNLAFNRFLTLPTESSSSFGVLGAFKNLASIDVSHTAQTAIGRSLDDFCDVAPESLIEFHAEVTNIGGHLPACALARPNLEVLNLAGNAMNGTLPEIPSGSALRIIKLNYQYSESKITGAIPTSFVNSSRLEYLFLNNLALSGKIPDAFANSRLSILNLQSNALSGTIPPTLAAEPYLTTLDLSNNALVGEVPAGLYDNPNRTYVDLSVNKLTKLSVATTFANPGANLEILDAGFNAIDEEGIPEVLTKSSGLKVLGIHQNKFHGSIVSASTTTAPAWDLYYLDASFNNFSGVVPNASHWGNIFDGGLRYYWASTPTANRLDISHNAYTSAPAWFANYGNVLNLNVRFMNNPIPCPLPSNLVNLTTLAVNCDFGINVGPPSSDDGILTGGSDDSPTDTNEAKEHKRGLHGAQLAGVLVLVGIVTFVLLALGVWTYKKWRRRRANRFHVFRDVEMSSY